MEAATTTTKSSTATMEATTTSLETATAAMTSAATLRECELRRAHERS
jgi:hypothetical protein